MADTKIRSSRQLTIDQDLDLINKKIINLGTPANDNDAATKEYVDSVAQGLKIRNSVMHASAPSDGNIVLSAPETGRSGYIDGLIELDGVLVSENDRILIKDQTDAKENGIYIAHATGGWIRASDFDNLPSGGEIHAGDFFFVQEGIVQHGTGWVLTTSEPIDIGISLLVFVQFSGAGSIIAGNGLYKNGSVIQIGDGTRTAGVAKDGIITSADDISVAVDNSTIEINSNSLRVKANGITSNEIASGAVTLDKINSNIFDNLAGNGLTQGSAGIIDVNVDGASLKITSDVLQVSADALADNITLDTIADGNNAVPLIPNSSDGNNANIHYDGFFSGTIGSSTKYLAFDRNDLTVVSMNFSGGSSHLYYDFGSAKTISGAYIKRGSLSGYNVVLSFVGSDNGSSWTVISTLEDGGANISDTNSRIYHPVFSNQAYRYYGIQATGTSGVTSIYTLAILEPNGRYLLEVKNAGIRGLKLNPDVAGNGLSQAVSGALDVGVDGSTLEINADALRVKDLGITTAKINVDAVDKTKIAADVAGLTISQNADGSLDVSIDNITIDQAITLGDAIPVIANSSDPLNSNIYYTGSGFGGILSSTKYIPFDNNDATSLSLTYSGSTCNIYYDLTNTTSIYGATIKRGAAHGSGFSMSLMGSSNGSSWTFVQTIESHAGSWTDASDATLNISFPQVQYRYYGIQFNGASSAVALKTFQLTGQIGKSRLEVKNDGITADKINSDVAGNGLSQESNGALAVNVGAGLKIQSDVVKINYVREKLTQESGDDVNFSLTQTPISGTEQIFLNGILQTETDDYTISGKDIIFLGAIKSIDKITACYFVA